LRRRLGLLLLLLLLLSLLCKMMSDNATSRSAHDSMMASHVPGYATYRGTRDATFRHGAVRSDQERQAQQSCAKCPHIHYPRPRHTLPPYASSHRFRPRIQPPFAVSKQAQFGGPRCPRDGAIFATGVTGHGTGGWLSQPARVTISVRPSCWPDFS
jgi:hypothetical protein